jgi:hypothetical protein
MTTTSSITAQSALASALESAHSILEATMADVTDDVARRPVPGTANSVGSSYAHAVFAEDAVVSGMLKNEAPLAATTWAGRTGFHRPMAGGHGDALGEWYRTVQVDLGACREYARAVVAPRLTISTAHNETLARPIDMSFVGFGSLPLASVFSTLSSAISTIRAVKSPRLRGSTACADVPSEPQST